MLRINVVGTTGSGKSTFSRLLAVRLGYPYLEMDAMFWRSNWQAASDADFFTELRKQLNQPTWVLDGNYQRTAAIKWAQVDTVIWIDYSFPRTCYQSVKRTLHRCLSKQELWGKTGNVETFRKSLMSRDSILLWMLKTYHSHRRRYEAMIRDPQYQHIDFVRLRSPRDARRYLAQLNY